MARDDDTVRFQTLHLGAGDVFSQAMVALGAAAGPALRDTVRAMGSSPEELTIDELGLALPEIERRIRLVMGPDAAGAALARLRRLILHWEEPAGGP